MPAVWHKMRRFQSAPLSFPDPSSSPLLIRSQAAAAAKKAEEVLEAEKARQV
jgi:hypothetical protein